jgi:divalent metal cation (Fe/Co/Zn/Cd) transporter
MPSRPETAILGDRTKVDPRRSAWSISLVSLVWTVLSGTAAVAIGIATPSGSLVALGAIGFVDGLGSATLVYHFRHALRHEKTSDHLEAVAHRVVSGGLIVVGFATVIVNVNRLVAGTGGETSLSGVALAGTSAVTLAIVSRRKLLVARHVGSPALRSDAHLSGVGATLAAITIVGMAVTHWLGWSSADAVAAIVVGAVGVIVGVNSGSWSGFRAVHPRVPRPVVVGFGIACLVAVVDAIR